MTKHSHIEQLIHDLCPNGVEYKTLGETCLIKTGKGITQKDATDGGIYPIISGGVGPMGYYHLKNRDANTVTISRVGANAGFVNYITEDFYLNDKCFSIIPTALYQEKILPIFLFKYLSFIEAQIKELQSAGGVPTINTQKLGAISFPLPPLSIQEEIVQTLDAFEKLLNNIDTEIQNRQCQYDHCREQLFEGIKGVSTKRLEEFAAVQRKRNRQHITENAYSITQSGLVPTKSFFKEKTNVTSSDTSGYYIVQHNWFVYSPSRVDVGSISYLKDEGPVIVSPIDVVFSIDTNICLPAYLLSYFFTREGNKNLLKNREGVEGTGRRNLPFEAIQEIDIPLPSIEEQKTITAKLETIEALIANLKEERDLRQKQFEHYREQLISLLK